MMSCWEKYSHLNVVRSYLGQFSWAGCSYWHVSMCFCISGSARMSESAQVCVCVLWMMMMTTAHFVCNMAQQQTAATCIADLSLNHSSATPFSHFILHSGDISLLHLHSLLNNRHWLLLLEDLLCVFPLCGGYQRYLKATQSLQATMQTLFAKVCKMAEMRVMRVRWRAAELEIGC